MFQNWIKILQLKCAGSALKYSETQVLVVRNQHEHFGIIESRKKLFSALWCSNEQSIVGQFFNDKKWFIF